jgi:tRNA/tmRNA/rRNA uracil-C5-methylase (TrmA/RlmC/RlmD family)
MAKPVYKRQISKEILSVTIEDVAFGGDGVTHLSDGKVCFIPFTLTGEEVDIEILDNRAKFAFGRVIKVTKPSDKRIEAACTYYGDCGGCQYGHVDYAYEVELKKNQLKDMLKRMGKINCELEVSASPQSEGYRKSIAIHTGKSGNIGFVDITQEKILDIKNCVVTDPLLNNLLKTRPEEIVKSKAIDMYLKTDGTILSTPRRPLTLKYAYQDYTITYDVHCFFQAQHKVLTDILDILQTKIKKADVLFDLFCGVGVFGIALQEHFEKVIGIEHAKRSVQLGQFNVQEMDKVHIFKGKVDDKFRAFYKKNHGASNVVIVDPSRQGLSSLGINDLCTYSEIDQIIYLSCEPSILCRDLKKITEKSNFRVTYTHLFDMFPRTKHFETLVILEKASES